MQAANHSFPGVVAFMPSPVISESKPVANCIHLLDALIADETISEILINRHDHVYVEKNGKLLESDIRFGSAETLHMLVDVILNRCGKTGMADEMRIIDGVLPDGSRVNIALPPVSVNGPSISVRKFPKYPTSLITLVDNGFISADIARFLKAAVELRINIMVSGNTSSGKTTLLNALSAHISPEERIVTIEDAPELQLHQKNVVRLETGCGANAAEYSTRALVKSSLRMRPDRIIVGEVRGSEAFDMMQAMNTGHSGCMTTIHANSPRGTLIRLEHMINMSNLNLSTRYIREQIAASIGIIVQTHRSEVGERRITHVSEIVGMEGDTITLQDIFAYQADPRAGKGRYVCSKTTSRHPQIDAALQRFRGESLQAAK